MDSGGEKDAPPAKIRKLQGAAMHKCKYMSQWKESFRLLKLSREIHTGKFVLNDFKLILLLVKLFSRVVVKYLVG